MAKPKEQLTDENNLIFNRCILAKKGNDLSMRQKEQGKKIKVIDINTSDFKEQYVQQRAWGVYIALICQPKALFDMSVVAQH